MEQHIPIDVGDAAQLRLIASTYTSKQQQSYAV
jgi:hypothetical protein